MTTLITSINWYTESQESCCSLDVLARLEGCQITQADSDEALLGLNNEVRVKEIEKSFRLYELRNSGYLPSRAAAVPIHLAFGSVLDDIAGSLKSTPAWIATDTYRTSGDVELGPFSTKRFMEWATEMELINVTASRLMGPRLIRAWMFTLRKRPVKRLLRQYTKEYINFYEERFKGFKISKSNSSCVFNDWDY